MSTESAFLSLFLDTPIYCLKEEVVEVEQKVPPAELSLNLNYLGKNKKLVVVLVDSPEKEFLETQHGQLLLKICGAVSLQLSDIALVNISENAHCSGKLAEYIDYQTLISFGIAWDPAGITSDTAYYRSVEISGKTMLLSDSLPKLEQDVEAKKALWSALKQIFL